MWNPQTGQHGHQHRVAVSLSRLSPGWAEQSMCVCVFLCKCASLKGGLLTTKRYHTGMTHKTVLFGLTRKLLYCTLNSDYCNATYHVERAKCRNTLPHLLTVSICESSVHTVHYLSVIENRKVTICSKSEFCVWMNLIDLFKFIRYGSEFSRDIEPSVEAGDRMLRVTSSCVQMWVTDYTILDSNSVFLHCTPPGVQCNSCPAKCTCAVHIIKSIPFKNRVVLIYNTSKCHAHK